MKITEMFLDRNIRYEVSRQMVVVCERMSDDFLTCAV